MKLMVHLRIKTGNRPIKTTLCLIWYTCFMCRLKTCNMLINEFSPYFCSFCSIIFNTWTWQWYWSSCLTLRGTHFHPREVVGISFLLYLCIYSFVFQSRSCSTFSVFGLHDQTASIWRWHYSAVSCFRCITCILFSFVGVLIVAHEMKRPHPPSLPLCVGREGATAGTRGSRPSPARHGPAWSGPALPPLSAKPSEPFIQIWQGERAIMFSYTWINSHNNPKKTEITC